MSSSSEKRVTLADIGRLSGYHGTTVGLALRNHPGIPEATREKIRKIADELGYTPDPALRALVVHRHGLPKVKGFSTIAVISDNQPAKNWRSESAASGREYFEGMTQRATELGYQLEEFSVGPDHKLQNRIDGILKARGITAVIITPLQGIDIPVHLNWNAYSAIAIGYSLCDPPLPRVTHQHRTGSQLAVESLMRLGYRRIAYLNPHDYEMRVGFGYSAGFFGTVNLYQDKVESLSIIPKDGTNFASEETIQWIKDKKPDAIIAAQDHLLGFLQSEGLRIPEDLGFVKLGVRLEERQIAGIYENSPTIGREAVSLVAQMQSANIRGYAPIRQVHLVQGRWIPGVTVRTVGKSLL